MIGAVEYRRRARDGLKRGKPRSLELFGIARDVSDEQSVAFHGLVGEIPQLSDRKITKKNIKNPMSQKLINRGLISSVVNNGAGAGKIEQKDINRIPSRMISSLNGYGSEFVEIDPADLIPHTLNNRNRYIGTLIVSRKSDIYPYLLGANRHARDKLVAWTNSDCNRKSLEPRIDLYCTPDEDAGFVTVRRVAEIMREENMPIVLEPAKSYDIPR